MKEVTLSGRYSQVADADHHLYPCTTYLKDEPFSECWFQTCGAVALAGRYFI